MDFSEHYERFDLGTKAWQEGSPHFLPVDAYVTREYLERIQASFWDEYMRRHA